MLNNVNLDEQNIERNMYGYDKITLQENVIEQYYRSEYIYENENYTMIIETVKEDYSK